MARSCAPRSPGSAAESVIWTPAACARPTASAASAGSLAASPAKLTATRLPAWCRCSAASKCRRRACCPVQRRSRPCARAAQTASQARNREAGAAHQRVRWQCRLRIAFDPGGSPRRRAAQSRGGGGGRLYGEALTLIVREALRAASVRRSGLRCRSGRMSGDRIGNDARRTAGKRPSARAVAEASQNRRCRSRRGPAGRRQHRPRALPRLGLDPAALSGNQSASTLYSVAECLRVMDGERAARSALRQPAPGCRAG